MFFVGGSVRDWLRGETSHDLDITVSENAFGYAQSLARLLGGAFVPLDEQEGVARMVWQGFTVDFSSFREDAETIEADLCKRDFTINAMAVEFDPEAGGISANARIIDPVGGMDDLRRGLIRASSADVFRADPLRLLRAYRFMAVLGFKLDGATIKNIDSSASLLLPENVAAERISYELDLIMASPRAAEAFAGMASTGLLRMIFPELEKGLGLVLPDAAQQGMASRSLTVLHWMEKILLQPEAYFAGYGEEMSAYLEEGRKAVRVKWAAFFYGFGECGRYQLREDAIIDDTASAQLVGTIARRLRWSREDERHVTRFMALRMWPVCLHYERWRGSGMDCVSCLRLVKAIGADLPGLFLLAMAASLASEICQKGDQPVMYEELTALYDEVETCWRKRIQPVLESPPLLTGNDLTRRFQLAPGPIFREILEGLEKARVLGEVKTREEAKAWVKGFLARKRI